MGLLLINKPEGITSFRALNFYKKVFNTKRIGHTGTLDLFASGLMIALVGSYARLASRIVCSDKEYKAVFSFGTMTDTLDPGGKVIAEGPLPDHDALHKVISESIGIFMQVPPVYSAIHMQGKRAYERVLAGEEVVMAPRQVSIDSFVLEDYSDGKATVTVSCSKGTYIRSLARDIAQALGTVAHVSALERTRVGAFHVSEAYTPSEDVKPILIQGPELLRAMGGISAVFPERDVCNHLLHGKPLRREWFTAAPEGDLAVFSPEQKLLCILRQENGMYVYESVFSEALS